jgi:hypothetical protein
MMKDSQDLSDINVRRIIMPSYKIVEIKKFENGYVQWKKNVDLDRRKEEIKKAQKEESERPRRQEEAYRRMLPSGFEEEVKKYHGKFWYEPMKAGLRNRDHLPLGSMLYFDGDVVDFNVKGMMTVLDVRTSVGYENTFQIICYFAQPLKKSDFWSENGHKYKFFGLGRFIGWEEIGTTMHPISIPKIELNAIQLGYSLKVDEMIAMKNKRNK